ncbi:MAG: PKD domain-containing protein [Chitinophagaceae bacterium]|nr:PKD domain-containing protein [Chitinophagaceae bacterium]
MEIQTRISLIATKYYWKFGDGTISDNSTPGHKFEKAGIYTVCLTVVRTQVVKQLLVSK